MSIKPLDKSSSQPNKQYIQPIIPSNCSPLLIIHQSQYPLSRIRSTIAQFSTAQVLTSAALQVSLLIPTTADQQTATLTIFHEEDAKIQKQKNLNGKHFCQVNASSTMNLPQQQFPLTLNKNLLPLSRFFKIQPLLILQPQLSIATPSPFTFSQQVAKLCWSLILISSYFIQCLKFMIYNQKNIKMASNIFRQTLVRFKHHQTIADIAQDCKKQLNISLYRTLPFTVADVLWKFEILEKKYAISFCEGSGNEWKEDEKKILLCFLLAYCQLLCKKISEINDEEWRDISLAFHNKDVLLMKYEAKSVERNSQRVHWQVYQQKLLASFLDSEMYGKWAQISRRLFFQSKGEFFKTPKQCRQHWFNHMNGSIKRGEWLLEQDLIILESVLDHGRKWARIVDLLQGRRTEHMIKNRYHSLITCPLKVAEGNKQCKNQGKIIKLLINQLSCKEKDGRNGGDKLILRLGQDQKLQNEPQQSLSAQQKQKRAERVELAQNGENQAHPSLQQNKSLVKIEQSMEVQSKQLESYQAQANIAIFNPYASNTTQQPYPLPFFYGIDPTGLKQGQLMAVPIYLPAMYNTHMFSY